MRPSVIFSWAAAITVMILFPIAVGIWVYRRYRVRWVVFLYGAGIFFIFQMILRIPAMALLGPILAPALKKSQALLTLYLIAVGFSAGLFESVGRWVGYRWLFRDAALYDWAHGMAYGIGHGGLESILLVGASSAMSLAQAILFTRMDPAQLRALLPEPAYAQVQTLLQKVTTMPWTEPLWAAAERVFTLPFHMAMSLVVLLAFTRRQARWLWVAVLAHGTLDTAVALLAQQHLPMWAIEAFIGVCGLASLWVIWRLRPILIKKPNFSEG